MMSNPIEIDEIIANLRATITSNKGGVQLNYIESDYYDFIGEHIPYRKLGYNSLLEFLESLKEFKIENNGFNKVVHVVSNGKTQHLEEMINKQKTNKRSKSKFRVVPPKNLNYTHNSYNSSMHYQLKKKKQPVNNFEKHTADVNPTIKENCRLPKIKYNEELKINSTKEDSYVAPTEIDTKKCNVHEMENKIFKKKDKLKVYAQDRLQKYEKKDIYQIEVKNEESYLAPTEIDTKKCNVHEMENKIFKKKDKLKVYAQDRLQKYEKKDIYQIEVKNEESYLAPTEIDTKKCNVHEMENKIFKKKDKLKVYAQDRLQKYVKKDIFQNEVKNEEL